MASLVLDDNTVCHSMANCKQFARICRILFRV